jgi:outer membrane receptor protein involved in Fe transport
LFLPSTYTQSTNIYNFGTSTGATANPPWPGAVEGAIGNDNVTWERAVMWDVGVEARFIDDRLSFEFSRFNQDRDNILTSLGIIPAIYGVPQANTALVNVGKTNNRGYDATLGWSERTRGGFRYNVEAFVSYARNKIIYRAEAPNPYPWMNETGFMIGQMRGLKSDGFFNTVEELHARPFNTYNNNMQTLGDLKYLDLNGDGLIDQHDIAPIGYPNRALYQFGLRLRFDYKGVDLRMLFNGTANGSLALRRISVPFFKVSGNAFRWQYDGRWTPEKYAAGEEILYPRITFDHDINSHNFRMSDFWLISNDFFNLKNIDLGYTFPSTTRFMQAASISSLRVYASANNVHTIWMDKRLRAIGIDPETRQPSGGGYTYIFPITRTFTLGMSIQF